MLLLDALERMPCWSQEDPTGLPRSKVMGSSGHFARHASLASKNRPHGPTRPEPSGSEPTKSTTHPRQILPLFPTNELSEPAH